MAKANKTTKVRVNFDTPACLYWSDITKAEYLQRRIIVYSIAYYELNGDAIVSDFVYDQISKQYLELVNSMTMRQREQTTYWYVFNNYDGSTGFDLYSRLDDYDKDYLMGITMEVLKLRT